MDKNVSDHLHDEPVLQHAEQQGRRQSVALNIIENPLKVSNRPGNRFFFVSGQGG
jgi:hypothetical protein